MPVSACRLKGAVQVPATAVVQCLVDDILDLFQAALHAAGCTPAQAVDQSSNAYKLHVSYALSGLNVLPGLHVHVCAATMVFNRLLHVIPYGPSSCPRL